MFIEYAYYNLVKMKYHNWNRFVRMHVVTFQSNIYTSIHNHSFYICIYFYIAHIFPEGGNGKRFLLGSFDAV